MPTRRNISPGTIPGRLVTRAKEDPGLVALEVIDHERGTACQGRLTLEDWDKRSNEVANGLIAKGVKRGDRVALPCAAQTWLDYAIAYVAVLKLGATAVPVLRQLGEHHLQWVCEASQAVGIVGETASAHSGRWCSGVDELALNKPSDPVDGEVQPDDDAEILFTSGTTGRPKGVVASHANLLFTHGKRTRAASRIVYHALPPATLAGQGLMLQALDLIPHSIIAQSHYADEDFLTGITRHRATDVVLVPALATSLTQFEPVEGLDLTSVKVVRTMSAPIPPTTLQKLKSLFPRATVINMYTTTESWPARTRIRFDPNRPTSVGRSELAGSVRIVDQAGHELPAGAQGNVELRLSGAPRRRYLDDQQASQEVYLAGGWVRTGDIGYLDADRYLYLVDRHSDLVISGGMNVSTIEVEAAISEFPAVIEAAAFGLPHRILGEYVAAAVRVTNGFQRAELDTFLEHRLGPARAPKRILVVDEFPRNAMGKVLKRELRDSITQVESDVALEDGYTNPLLDQLGCIWADALGQDSVSTQISFVDLGGTSLSAMEITSRVRDELGRRVSQRDIFLAEDLRDFADRVDKAPLQEGDASIIGQIRRAPRKR